MSIVSVTVPIPETITAVANLFTFKTTAGPRSTESSSLTWNLSRGGIVLNLENISDFERIVDSTAATAGIETTSLASVKTAIRYSAWVAELHAGTALPAVETIVFKGSTGHVHLMNCAVIPWEYKEKPYFLCGIFFATVSVLDNVAVTVTMKTTNFLFYHNEHPVYTVERVALSLADQQFIEQIVVKAVPDMNKYLHDAYPEVFKLLEQVKPTADKSQMAMLKTIMHSRASASTGALRSPAAEAVIHKHIVIDDAKIDEDLRKKHVQFSEKGHPV